MAEVIVAVACNLIMLLFLVGGIFSAINNGVRVTLLKLFLTIGGGVGAYFLTPVISDKLYKVGEITTFLTTTGGGISKGTVNSCIFLLWFLVFYIVILIACAIVRHFLVKKLRDKKLNKLKMKRAKSINPSAEKMAKRDEWRKLKLKYAEKRRWYHRLFSGIVGAIIAILIGFVVVMPYGYIAKDINYTGNKAFLEKGYEYTLNGVIGEKVPDFLTHVENNAE